MLGPKIFNLNIIFSLNNKGDIIGFAEDTAMFYGGNSCKFSENGANTVSLNLKLVTH